MLQKPGTIIACLHTSHSEYISNLNKFIRENNKNIKTLTTENDKLYARGHWTGLYRPLICFHFDSKTDMQQCFSMTTGKSAKVNDPRFYTYFNGKKLRIDDPIWIPTRYLAEIEFEKQIQKSVDIEIKTKYVDLKRQYQETIENKDEIWKLYTNIKYGIDKQPLAQTAHYEMIVRDQLIEKFCKIELEKIKQQ